MEKVAVKFKYGSTEMSFYNTEIARVLVKTSTPRIVQRLKNGKPSIIITGEPYRVIELGTWLDRGDTALEDGTRAKIETLRSQDGIMTIYYRYGYDNAYTHPIHVQMVKSDVVDPYFAGYKRANVRVIAVFYEASTGKATPSPYLINVVSGV